MYTEVSPSTYMNHALSDTALLISAVCKRADSLHQTQSKQEMGITYQI